MNHLEFIEKHVREDLRKKGYTPGIAQGGSQGAGILPPRLSIQRQPLNSKVTNGNAKLSVISKNVPR